MALFKFDASQHNATLNFEALPKGWYKGFVSDSEMANTNSGGQMIKLTIDIFEPAFAKGRKVFANYNVVNQNEETSRIALEQLAALSISAKYPKWDNTEELHNKPFHIKLKIEKAKEGTDYEDKNVPNGYDFIDVKRSLAKQPGVAPVAGGSAPFTPPPAAPSAPAQQFAVPAAPSAAPAAVASAPVQPWDNAPAPSAHAPAPVVAAPVAPVVAAPAKPVVQLPEGKSPEQLAWEAQQAAAKAEVPVVPATQAAPAVPSAPAPVAGAQPQPWANQTVEAAAEPQKEVEQHPAQAATPPWMTGK